MFCLPVVCCHVIADLLANSPYVRKEENGKATGSVNVRTASCWSFPTDREAVATLPKVLERLHLEWPRFPCISSVPHLTRAELWGAIQALSGVDEKTNIQFLINAKYVAKGDTQRGELEYGPNGDLWSIVFRLIDGRSGTDVIKVMSHLKDVGSSVILQDEMAFHPMLAISLADVLAEEAAKRLLPDMNSEQRAERIERTGVSVAKRLALVQFDTLRSSAKFQRRHREFPCQEKIAQYCFQLTPHTWQTTLPWSERKTPHPISPLLAH